jgi:hypothetical protein
MTVTNNGGLLHLVSVGYKIITNLTFYCHNKKKIAILDLFTLTYFNRVCEIAYGLGGPSYNNVSPH